MGRAAAFYDDASQIYDRLLALTREYYSLPNVKEGINASASDALMNLGVAYEKLREYAKAEAAYTKALRLNPRLARAHYNLAVLYWNRDWGRVVAELQSALSIDPANPEFRRFLALAEAALRASRHR
jgi:tetratricopeptide (TPR) repeat protein